MDKLRAFTMSVPSEEKALRIIESPIWENTITPAIGEVADLLMVGLAHGSDGVIIIAPILRALFEVLYIHGYREGAKNRRPPLTFFCPEEASGD